jgi:hypothetical protein
MFNPNITYQVGIAQIEELRRQASAARLVTDARRQAGTPASAPQRSPGRGATVFARVARLRSAI